MLNIDNTVLMVIDVQEKLVKMLKNPDEITKNNSILVKSANILGVKTIVTEQYPRGLGKTIEELKTDTTFEKTSFSAMENQIIADKIAEFSPENVILTGIETHICVYQTALDLLQKGYKVYIVKNATASRNKKDYKTALELIRDFGGKLTCVETVLFELLKSSTHPKFKEIQSFIK